MTTDQPNAVDRFIRPFMILADECNRRGIKDDVRVVYLQAEDLPVVTAGHVRLLVREWMRERMVDVQIAEDMKQ